ncbi:MAG: antibiotic biosynthesis monooxygenase family protein [Myxococcota bacterium]
MYNVINHVRVVPEHRDAFEEEFEASLVHMEGVEGFIRVRVWRPSPSARAEGTYPHDAYMIETEWEDEAAFRAWVGSPSFRASHAKPMPEEWRAGAAMMSQHVLALERQEGS